MRIHVRHTWKFDGTAQETRMRPCQDISFNSPAISSGVFRFTVLARRARKIDTHTPLPGKITELEFLSANDIVFMQMRPPGSVAHGAITCNRPLAVPLHFLTDRASTYRPLFHHPPPPPFTQLSPGSIADAESRIIYGAMERRRGSMTRGSIHIWLKLTRERERENNWNDVNSCYIVIFIISDSSVWQDSLLEKAEEEILSLYIYMKEKWLRIPFVSKRLIKWEFIYKLFFRLEFDVKIYFIR